MKNAGLTLMVIGGLLLLWGGLAPTGVVASSGFGRSGSLPGVIGNTPMMFSALRFLLIGGFTLLTGALLFLASHLPLGEAVLKQPGTATPPIPSSLAVVIGIGVAGATILVIIAGVQHIATADAIDKATLSAASAIAIDASAPDE